MVTGKPTGNFPAVNENIKTAGDDKVQIVVLPALFNRMFTSVAE